MSRDLTGKNLNFRPVKPRSNAYRVLLWVVLILGAGWLLLQVERGEVQSPFMPTPTPTRMPQSYILEAIAYFEAGKLDDPTSDQDAIGAYKQALNIDPDNALAFAELARIQTYSSSLTSTDQERLQRLQEALASVEEAIKLAPDDSTVNAIYALVLDWNAASNLITARQRESYLVQAEAAATHAFLLDPENALALAFYAEVSLDQQKWDQALEYARQAVERAPDLMDTHRVYATVLETVGEYFNAIEEYVAATRITPNLTFLYLRIGVGYRHLKDYTTALEYFERAARINKQLGIRDPLPYIAIAKTYAQDGEFFAASLNAETALLLSPTSADTYGQLGAIYVQARNYESALPTLRCAVEGCSAEENETLRVLIDKYYVGDEAEIPEIVRVEPLELTNLTVAYYYIRYGSVLAFLRSDENDYCERMYTLMAELRVAFPDDPSLLENIETNEETCLR